MDVGVDVRAVRGCRDLVWPELMAVHHVRDVGGDALLPQLRVEDGDAEHVLELPGGEGHRVWAYHPADAAASDGPRRPDGRDARSARPSAQPLPDREALA